MSPFKYTIENDRNENTRPSSGTKLIKTLLSPEVEFAAHCLNGCLDEVGNHRSVTFDGLPGRRLIGGLVNVLEKVRQTSEARASVRVRAARSKDDVAARDTVSKKKEKKQSIHRIIDEKTEENAFALIFKIFCGSNLENDKIS
jgi:hypothetical protein